VKIVLYEPEIPHNTGAVGRICVNLNAELHLIEPLGFSLSESQVRRVGLDYWRHVRLTVHSTWEAFLDVVAPQRMFLFSTRGSRSYLECSFQSNDVLVFGSETRGLPEILRERYAEYLTTIPMPGPHARSHNLANAVAIVAYEVYRQITSACQE
jgi:tRNA (cytidine/uridine-2'-O-)-methyltransferase